MSSWLKKDINPFTGRRKLAAILSLMTVVLGIVFIVVDYDSVNCGEWFGCGSDEANLGISLIAIGGAALLFQLIAFTIKSLRNSIRNKS